MCFIRVSVSQSIEKKRGYIFLDTGVVFMSIEEKRARLDSYYTYNCLVYYDAYRT